MRFPFRGAWTLGFLAWMGLAVPTECRAAGTLTNCNDAALFVAIQGGGLVKIACDGVMNIASTLEVGTNLVFDATGRAVTLLGGSSNRLFTVKPGIQLALTNITLSNGAAIGAAGTKSGDEGQTARGGAILNLGGTVILHGVTATANKAIGGVGVAGAAGLGGVSRAQDGGAGGDALGGVVYNEGGTLLISNSTFIGNTATGAAGGNGGTAASVGNGADGGDGGGGGFARGGALFNTAGGIMRIVATTFATNQVTGATNGVAGDGAGFLGFPGKSEPAGGAFGGAIYNDGGTVELVGSTLHTNVCVAANATGGYGGLRDEVGQDGFQGGAARGGAIWSANGSLVLTNCTLGNNRVTGGQGGRGGDGGTVGFGGRGGDGGAGGDAVGGALYHGEGGVVNLVNCTLANNFCVPQVGGVGGAGGGSADDGPTGGTGLAAGASFYSAAPGLSLRNTLLVNTATTSVCGGVLVDAGHNLSSDPSCDFTAEGSKDNVALTLGSLASNGGLTQTFALPAGSPAIDAGADGAAPALDQRGAGRNGPSDVGAYEYNGVLQELQLAIALQPSNSVLISWPVSSTTYDLESTPSLAGTPVWTKITTSPTVANGRNTITFFFDVARYYRLRKP